MNHSKWLNSHILTCRGVCCFEETVAQMECRFFLGGGLGGLCLCACMCAALVILTQLIVVFWWTPALPLSPRDSVAFRWAYLSTHEPSHSQAVVYGADSLSVSSQSINLTNVLNDRHNVVLFVFYSRRSAHFYFLFLFKWATKRQQKIINSLGKEMYF